MSTRPSRRCVKPDSQDPRPARLRGHAQGWPLGRDLPRPAGKREFNPGVTTDHIRPPGLRIRTRSRRRPGDADVSRVTARPPARPSITLSVMASPSEKPLRDGDIVNVDVTLILDGWHGNSSRMYAVGEIPRRARTAYRSHLRSDDAWHCGDPAGYRLPATSVMRSRPTSRAQHMSVVRDFCGHGLGKLFHDEPNNVHVGRPGEGLASQARDVFHRRADDQSRGVRM